MMMTQSDDYVAVPDPATGRWLVKRDGITTSLTRDEYAALKRGHTAESDAALARVRALVDQWNETPDHTPTAYDQGRVDQRHDMTMQLLDALGSSVTPPDVTD